jgi:hypothetical protein
MNKRIESYMVAILSNPEWMKSVARRYGSYDTAVGYSVGMPEIATAVLNLETALTNKLPDEKFDVDAFANGSEPPPRF